MSVHTPTHTYLCYVWFIHYQIDLGFLKYIIPREIKARTCLGLSSPLCPQSCKLKMCHFLKDKVTRFKE